MATQTNTITIQEQVKLPLSVAFGVVMQGIRIRFGRSIVTIMGVVLGIAFLMSILTGQVIKDGVKEEDVLRTEAKRMESFLIAETGPLQNKAVGLLLVGEPSEAEIRLVGRLEKAGVSGVFANAPGGSAQALTRFPGTEERSIEKIAEDTAAVIVAGEGTLAETIWQQIRQVPGNRIVAFTRDEARPSSGTGQRLVSLARELRPDELEKMQEEARKAKFRNIWIVIISLVVTVIGISNAMLMSVTERFREIGTMKCLGALSRFIRILFLIEASIMGVSGALLGCLVGALFSLVAYSFIYGFGLVFGSIDYSAVGIDLVMSLLAGIVLAIVAAIYPANVASSMVPADALRTNI